MTNYEDTFIQKMLNHYNQGGLIIFAKSNNYFGTNTVSEEDINIFYELVIDVNGKFKNNPFQITLLSCVLYDQALTSQKSEELFFQWIISKINRTDAIDRTNLYRIYNIIEYEDKFRKCNDNQYDFLNEYLDRFISFEKNYEEYLLFKYYKGILLLLRRNYIDAFKETMEILTSIVEETEKSQKSNFIQYIQIKNNLLTLRVFAEDPKADLNEYSQQANTIFTETKEKNKVLGIKIGIQIYEIFKKKNQYHNCLMILKELSNLLKKELLNGTPIEYGINYYLAISSRLAYVATFLNDKKLIKKSMKKLEKTINLLSVETSNATPTSNSQTPNFTFQKDFLNKTAYNFIMLIYNINNNIIIPQSKQNEIINKFKSSFIIPQVNSMGISQRRLISNNFFGDDEINASKIDIYSINNSDPLSPNVNIYIENLITKVKQNILQAHEIIPLIFGIYNLISGYSLSILTDPNVTKNKEYNNNIKMKSELILDYSKHNSILSCFKLPYIRKALIKIYIAHVGVLFRNNQLKEINQEMENFELLLRSIDLGKDKNTEYLGEDENNALLSKIKGDYYFKTEKFKDAIQEYEKALTKLTENDHNKSIVLFNLGCCYYLINDAKKCSDNLNLAINLFNNLGNKVSSSNYQINYQEKIQKAEQILNSLQ